MKRSTNTHFAYLLLRGAYGTLPIITGIDKFFNVLVNWEGYIAPNVSAFIPFDMSLLFIISGVFEIVLGLIILIRKTTAGPFIAAGWLLGITIIVTMGGFYDVALRDAVLAAGAVALACLSSNAGKTRFADEEKKSNT